ncbi:hypothetical protein TWF569_001371 [Orbilia oligospora]|uniref:Uncharacterized protein n=2 Tax=Orbilia oligospora TaxID=2813651 RepID=A0A7C8JIR1_ORBOL|nr:hypothetical protein TWF706_001071 [Orbilia oligospora]KAF3107078.1 hypothetical protein TWF102_000915 [Orbilia oligospora]KAF3117406.1 hypothetical protein TWF103_006154 [Orbilia oligospora]KAF3137378.1 hypothetical protein TWF594_007507 [Orbilia oligospora]KAF3153764.1 hypothetical protein TWF569_001371 [Orbilia oligospora]
MSRSKVGLLVAAGVGIAGGKYLFEPLILEQKQKAEEEAKSMSSLPKVEEASPQQQPAPTTATLEQPQAFFDVSQTPSAIANTRTLACLPSTEISKSAHPNDAAKIMDHPLPSSPLIAKKIPSKEDSGEMQAEPYTQSPGGVGLFGKVRFW